MNLDEFKAKIAAKIAAGEKPKDLAKLIAQLPFLDRKAAGEVFNAYKANWKPVKPGLLWSLEGRGRRMVMRDGELEIVYPGGAITVTGDNLKVKHEVAQST